MPLIPSEFSIGGVYFPPLLIASLLGFFAAWIDKTFVDGAVNGAGAVTEVGLSGQTTETNLMFEGCVLNVMSGLTFEAPADGEDVLVNYPFVFRSEPDDTE